MDHLAEVGARLIGQALIGVPRNFNLIGIDFLAAANRHAAGEVLDQAVVDDAPDPLGVGGAHGAHVEHRVR